MDVQEILFAKKLAGGGGGGENTWRIINGTMANIFDDIDLERAGALSKAGSLSAIIHADATVLGIGAIYGSVYYAQINGEPCGLQMQGADPGAGSCYRVAWFEQGVGSGPFGFMAYINGTTVDLSAYGQSIPAALYLYDHPMPDLPLT